MKVHSESHNLVLISNIPKCFRASHLRNFFSQYVQSSKFKCFHFRHRPDIIISPSDNFVGAAEILSAIKHKKRNKLKACAFVLINLENLLNFMMLFNGLHWLDIDDQLPLNDKCVIKPISQCTSEIYEQFHNLIEFKLPSFMPQGNVGTPEDYFFQLIKNCKLEASIISKLGLNFSYNLSGRVYGAVSYVYDADSTIDYNSLSGLHEPRSGNGIRLCNDADYNDHLMKNELMESDNMFLNKSNTLTKPKIQNNYETGDCDNDDEDVPEEWDRFESLHDDPYNINRGNKAHIKYENKVELVWEKGGSGLVFHTDQQTWEKLDPLRREERFDEPASFDWDIDMEPYENPSCLNNGPTPNGGWGSARDTSDLIDINRSRLSMNIPYVWHDPKALCKHELVDETYGLKLLRQMGWKPGTFLGPTKTLSKLRVGLLNPLTSDGSLGPHVRTGLGYYGPKVFNRRHLPSRSITANFRHNKPSYSKPTVYIRSIFDNLQTVSKRHQSLGLISGLLRREDPSLIVKWSSDNDNGQQVVTKISTRDLSNLSQPNQSSGKEEEEVQQSRQYNCHHRTIILNPHEEVQQSRQYNCHHRTIILNPHANLSKEGISFVFGGLLINPSSLEPKSKLS